MDWMGLQGNAAALCLLFLEKCQPNKETSPTGTVIKGRRRGQFVDGSTGAELSLQSPLLGKPTEKVGSRLYVQRAIGKKDSAGTFGGGRLKWIATSWGDFSKLAFGGEDGWLKGEVGDVDQN